ncbi:dna topoisomerase 3-alpha [Fusarium albosuccineum]|uniref:Dna topoisomerase 3-alpha n=1 Tax=Fusarium albosuccineum TaxID=1237068 RepID=A0A8H4PDQ1_9HYPO|nr:dna topoisomerase 3-alpha [Fusarium albosuccineum]
MASTPRGKNRQPPNQPETPRSSKKRLHKGRYSDGHWWCNCEPRNRASLRETKKAGPNKGRFYWKCDDCSFFLWHDEAKARENAFKPTEIKPPTFTQQSLVSYGYQVTPGRRLSNIDPVESTDSGEESEPDTPMPKSTEAAEPGPSRPTTRPPRGLETPSRGPTKRRRDVFEEDEDEFSDLGSDEERQMAVIADKSAEKAAAQRRRYATPTPSRSADVIAGLPTPSVSRTLFPGTDSKRQKQVSFEDTPARHSAALSSTTISTNTTPSRTPAGLGLQAVPTSSPSDNSHDVTNEVMSLLRGQKIDSGVLLSVENILTTAARRTKGIILGRDSARASLKAKDEKLATLQERIAALENREKMLRSQMTNIKAGLMKMYDDN